MPSFVILSPGLPNIIKLFFATPLYIFWVDPPPPHILILSQTTHSISLLISPFRPPQDLKWNSPKGIRIKNTKIIWIMMFCVNHVVCINLHNHTICVNYIISFIRSSRSIQKLLKLANRNPINNSGILSPE